LLSELYVANDRFWGEWVDFRAADRFLGGVGTVVPWAATV
jgi:hypothetical protein